MPLSETQLSALPCAVVLSVALAACGRPGMPAQLVVRAPAVDVGLSGQGCTPIDSWTDVVPPNPPAFVGPADSVAGVSLAALPSGALYTALTQPTTRSGISVFRCDPLS